MNDAYIWWISIPTIRCDDSMYLGWAWDLPMHRKTRILNGMDIHTGLSWEDIGLSALVNDY